MTEHAALMDDVYRYQRYIYDFTRKYYLFGRDRLITRSRSQARRARDRSRLRHVAQSDQDRRRLIPARKLFGLDASAEMLLPPPRRSRRAGLNDRIKLIQAYAENLTPALFGESAPFDEVVFSYSLSMIPDWKQALKAASQVLAAGGLIHIVDFGDLKGLGPVAERILRGWLSLFHVAPRDELLQTIEQQDVPGHLYLLAGRYAFIWTGGGGQPLFQTR